MKAFIRKHNLILSLAVTLIWFAVTVLISNAVYADEASGFCDCSTAGEASNNVICHIPPGNHQNMHTIRVGDPAIHAHLNHGDMLGPCPGDEAEVESEHEVAQGLPACTCDDGTVGSLYHIPQSAVAFEAYSLRSVSGQ
ncbi:hypothetical protein MMIC_P0394 [Mariprofundus micogutta]|uniref:Uncharacterized protein n=1 Tax=Mariprofundus micogutta TaxID=1921010 RepID=A0A1L8CKM7_9PROT|nr:hypothetical protein [Mariprofundus micogutta]GAV19460.1 hypothetical protein MMIC_P0394 [Mariprofundus micogutta]